MMQKVTLLLASAAFIISVVNFFGSSFISHKVFGLEPNRSQANIYIPGSFIESMCAWADARFRDEINRNEGNGFQPNGSLDSNNTGTGDYATAEYNAMYEVVQDCNGLQ